jgi:hypothetical protein
MIRLRDLLNDAKQVGDIYHFTPLSNVSAILKTQYMTPNEEQQISATRWADMSTAGFQDMKSKPVARFMFDGNKLSTKYQIRPFSYSGEGLSGADLTHSDFEKLGEEQIVINGRNFYFMPYLKRIDIFVQKGNPDLSKSIAILDKINIPYSVYQGTPRSNIPFNQSKEGDPNQLKYNPVAKEILISTKELRHPYPNYKTYKFNNNQQTYPLPEDIKSLTNKKQYRVKPAEIFGQTWDVTPLFPDYYVRFASNGTIDSINDDFEESKYMAGNDKYILGRDFRNPITKLILNSIQFKTWRELGLEEKINTLISKIVQYIPSVQYDHKAGLQMIPKQIVNKYLTPYEAKSIDYETWVKPKATKTTKYDWSGIDTPGDPTM